MRGVGVVAHIGRLGFSVLHTQANGDCGIDALLILAESRCGVLERNALRKKMQAFVREVEGKPAWQDAFFAAGELIPGAKVDAIGAVSTSAAAESSRSKGLETQTGPVILQSSSVVERSSVAAEQHTTKVALFLTRSLVQP